MPFEHLSPGAQQVVKPGMTPYQQAQALHQKQLSTDAVKSLAHGMPENKSVQWAAASAEKVSNPAHTTDLQAIQSAKAWCRNPTPQNQQLAGQAASNAGHQTPGSWAAQAAASAGKGGTLTPHAVTGAVLLSAAQGGKPIAPSGPSIPQQGASQASETGKPTTSRFQLPFFKKPTTTAPTALAPTTGTLQTQKPGPMSTQPQTPAQSSPTPPPGPDGHSLTPAQRATMSKNIEPFLKLGCDIGQGKA
jgi:hypothetical protein